ncbi:ABC transporter substrate-binding protein [Lederbergia galactosidilytica]|uniref:ABC transporter substrate-binding protein n=1 Tax=Lederbergia galactosidilytica TaxID=217031 RepID=A0A177ZII2_9BACI|nr:extracellular solute-binding protein [Lederbergia galactosidilytica]KRG15383.1 ABC transporter substrate-binding protein [Virgibacillus soli]MBP1915818.1 raffinose/stachyose/melibiose transport system substrate-binding protein [Lederbergia galactosidilytica]OAK67160.1 ABC transporter substrate-binding protein [Lederbergia galactosidilytica]
MKKTVSLLVAGALSISLLAGCASGENAAEKDGKVKIEFFHHKREGMETFDKLIEKFEEENPDITVEQASPPEPSTVIRTRVSKGDMPDIVAVGGDMTYKDLADAGVFTDVSDDEKLEKVQPSYIQMLKDISGKEEVYAIPFATNAVGVIYNKTIFKELGLEIPKTWDELLAVAEEIQSAGQIPFYHTYKDAWTTLPSFNALAANTQGEDFYSELNEGNILAGERFKEAAEKMVELAKYGHKNQQGVAYNDGNTAFANGKAAMYLQGIWVIPEIKKANPDIDLGVFPFPATNNADEIQLVSGVDLLFGIAESSKHKEEAMKFVEFLLQDENAQQYITEQNSFSALKGIVQEDPSVEALNESFEKGALSDFPDHYIPTGVAPDKSLQTLVQDKDIDAFLKKIQADWEKVENRK